MNEMGSRYKCTHENAAQPIELELQAAIEDNNDVGDDTLPPTSKLRTNLLDPHYGITNLNQGIGRMVNAVLQPYIALTTHMQTTTQPVQHRQGKFQLLPPAPPCCPFPGKNDALGLMKNDTHMLKFKKKCMLGSQ